MDYEYAPVLDLRALVGATAKVPSRPSRKACATCRALLEDLRVRCPATAGLGEVLAQLVHSDSRWPSRARTTNSGHAVAQEGRGAGDPALAETTPEPATELEGQPAPEHRGRSGLITGRAATWSGTMAPARFPRRPAFEFARVQSVARGQSFL